ncbi:MAG: adenylate/guanylate cyclase domain-containing protein [Elusimicrobia bacterium]|nr:adenylate/guanylate cyclase domain-containing protein [Elusimicrobiota bacterium]
MRKNRFARVFCLLCALAFPLLYAPVLVGIERPGVFTGVGCVWQDLLFRLRPGVLREGDPKLVLAAVDDETGKAYGFPLPRGVYARALDALKSYGVRTVVFDVLLFEPGPEDAKLAAATRRFGRVVHLYTLARNAGNTLPVSVLRASTPFLGYPDITRLLDPDGHVRGFILFDPEDRDPFREDAPAASLEAAALSAHLDVPVERIAADRGLEPFGEYALNFRRVRTWPRHEHGGAGGAAGEPGIASSYRRISLVDVLSGRLSPAQREALRGGLVILGSTTLGYYDHYPTPFLEAAPGAEFHMNAVDNALHGDALRRAPRFVTLLLMLGMLAASYALHRLSTAAGAAGAAAALLGWLAFALWVFGKGWILEFVPPAAVFLFSYLVLTAHRALTEGAEKRQIKGMFGQFVSPEVVEELASNPEKARLGAQKREMTVLFLDIAHFTTISEKMGAEALMAFLNRYFSVLSRAILDRRGTIDKYIGDCIMAFWNAPLENPRHRADAVLAALDCQRAMAELNASLGGGLPQPPAIRIGVNSGEMNVGFTGTERKLQYTVIGDEVNLASRLEGANKFFGSKILVSGAAFEGARDAVEARYLGRVRVVGKDIPIAVYEPLAEKGLLDAEWVKALPVFARGVELFDERRYDRALPLFEEFGRLRPGDGPGRTYLELCRGQAAAAADAAWPGVFNLTSK